MPDPPTGGVAAGPDGDGAMFHVGSGWRVKRRWQSAGDVVAAPLLGEASPVADTDASPGETVRALTALALFAVLNALQGVTWAPFSSLPAVAEQLYGFDAVVLTWQQNANNLAQAIATPIAAWIVIRPNGLRVAAVLGSVTAALQCLGFASVLFAGAGLRVCRSAWHVCGCVDVCMDVDVDVDGCMYVDGVVCLFVYV